MEESKNTELDDLVSKIRSVSQTTQAGPGKVPGATPIKLNTVPKPTQSFESFSNETEDNFYKTLSSGKKVAKFENYITGTDNTERLALEQSTSSRIGNGLTKAGANFLTTVVGNTAGLVVGLAEGIKQGNMNAVFENSFSETLADWNEKLSYQLPNYVSKDERNNNFFESALTANFWANDVASGLSFTLGTIVSEAIWGLATGGAGTAAKWGLAGAKLGSKLRYGKAALGVEQAAVGLARSKSFVGKGIENLYRTGAIEMKTAKYLSKTAKGLGTVRFLATTSGNEAGIEALHYKREARENFYEGFEAANGREPSPEEASTFENNLANSANAVYTTNLAILAPSNMAMFGSLFNISSPTKGVSKALNKNLFGIGIEKVAGEGGVIAYKGLEATGKQKALQYGYAALKPLVTEGLWEEGLQGVASGTAKNWIESTYNPKYHADSMELSDAVYEAFAEQYGTKEGWKEIGIGAIIGLGSSLVIGGGNFQEVKEFAKDQKYQENYVAKGLNTFGDSSAIATDILTQKFMLNARVQSARERQQEAASKGDDVAAVLAQQDLLLAEIQFRKTIGEDTSTLISKYQTALDTLTDEQYEEAGITDISGHKSDVMAGYKSLLDSYEKASDFADAVLGETRILGQDVETRALKDALTYSIVSGEKSAKVMDGFLQDIGAIIGEDSKKALQVQTDLQRMGRNKQAQVNKANKAVTQADNEVKALSDELRKLQASSDESKGTRLAQVQLRLDESLAKQIEVKEQRESLARELTIERNRSKNIDSFQVSGEELTGTVITGEDLADIDEKLLKIDETIKGYEGNNHEVYYELLDLKKQYLAAKSNFFNYQTTVDSIIKGDFKLEFAKTEGLLGKVFNSKKPLNDFTAEFLNEMYGHYTSKMDAEGLEGQVGALRNFSVSQEEYDEFKESGEISDETLNAIALKVRNNEELDDREKEVFKSKSKEINTLLKPNPNKPNLDPQFIINSAIRNLEELQAKIKAELLSLTNAEDETRRQELKESLKQTEETITETVTINNPLTREELEEHIIKLRERHTALLESYDTEQNSDTEVDGFAEEANNGVLESEEVNFEGGTAIVYTTAQDDSWSGKGSSFVKTWNVLKFNQSFPGTSTFAHVRLLMTAAQKAAYSADKNSDFSKSLRELAKNNRDSNTVRLIDIRPASERSGDNDKQELSDKITALDERINKEVEELDNYEGTISLETTSTNPEYTAIEDEIKALEEKADTDERRELNSQLEEVELQIATLKGETSDMTEAEKLRNTVLKAFEKDYRLLTTDVDELIQDKPTKAEVERYFELYNDRANLTLFDLDEYSRLQAKMQKWHMAESLPVGDMTIADLVELIEQLETQSDTQDTVDDIDNEVQFAETTSNLDSRSAVRYDIGQTVGGTAMVKRSKGNIFFSHINAESIIEKLLEMADEAFVGVPVYNKDGSLKDQVVVEPLTPSKLRENAKKEGAVFVVGDVKFTIGKRGAIVFEEAVYQQVKDVLNLHFFDSKTGKWSSADLYEVLEDGTTIKRRSDFKTNTDAEALYKVGIGETIELFVDMKTDWNRDLIEDSLREIDENGVISEETRQKITDTLEITFRSPAGNVATLKAAGAGVNDQQFRYLRNKYASKFINTLEEEGALATLPKTLDLKASLKVKYMFIGTPNLQLDQTFTPKELEITERGTDAIITQGYATSEGLTLADKSLDTEEISNLHITNVVKANPGSKVPVIILRKGKHLFAFPITMVKVSESREEQLNKILEEATSPVDAVKRINALLISMNSGTRITKLDETVIDNLMAEVSGNTTFTSANALANVDYDKARLQSEATVKVDLENDVISSPKVIVDFDTLSVGTLDDNETDEVKLRETIVQSMRELEKTINSSKEIPDQGRFVQAFDNNVVENQGSDILNRKDVNFIKKVFFDSNGNRIPLSGKVVDILGKAKLIALRNNLETLSFYENQTRITKNREAEEKLKCKV